MRVAIFIGEADEHRQLLFALARTLAAAGLRGVLQIAALIAVEVDVDRIDRYHRGQHGRSEEHTSELQSLMRISYAVFCLKKKNNTKDKIQPTIKQTKNTVDDNMTDNDMIHNTNT